MVQGWGLCLTLLYFQHACLAVDVLLVLQLGQQLRQVLLRRVAGERARGMQNGA